MLIQEEFSKLRVMLVTEEIGRLTRVRFETVCDDYDVFEDIVLYMWRMELRIALTDGSVRKILSVGHHDICPLLELLPGADAVVPTEALASPLSVEVDGFLELEGARFTFRHSFNASAVDLPFEVEPGGAPHSQRCVSAETVEPETRYLPEGKSGNPLAVVPDVGIVEENDGRLVLRSSEGLVSLHKLDSLLASIPGQPSFYRGLTLVGGAKGRLAVHVSRELPGDRCVNRVFIVALPSCDVLLELKELVGGTVAGNLAGFFNSDAEFYACVIRQHSSSEGTTTHFRASWVGIAIETSEVVAKWQAPVGQSEKRWEWVGDDFYGCDSTGVMRFSAKGEIARERRPWFVDGWSTAYHPTCEVSAWLIDYSRDGFGEFALGVGHDDWGMHQIPLPQAAFDASLAVLPDGRVLVVGGEAYIVTPDIGAVVALGPVEHSSERLLLTEKDGATWLWTNDAARFGLRIPNRFER